MKYLKMGVYTDPYGKVIMIAEKIKEKDKKYFKYGSGRDCFKYVLNFDQIGGGFIRTHRGMNELLKGLYYVGEL